MNCWSRNEELPVEMDRSTTMDWQVVLVIMWLDMDAKQQRHGHRAHGDDFDDHWCHTVD